MTNFSTDLVGKTPPAEVLRLVDEPRALIPGNRVALLRNGAEVFPAWLEAIAGARDRISLEMYIFNDDTTGRRFAGALMAAAKRGIAVRLLYDFVGCRDASPAFFARMREAGVHTIAYHKHRFWRPRFWALWRRNHRKTLVVDGRVAFTGGINIADEWAPASEGGGDWRDAVLAVEGPAVAAIEAVFLATWNRRARRRARLDPVTLARPAPAGHARLRVISNTERVERFAIRRAALYAMSQARQRIYLVNPYFVPDLGILRVLAEAAGNGLDVRVLVPERSDSRILDLAARATFGRLLRARVRIFEHQSVVHAKALLVDQELVSIGSYNLDHRSLAFNLEIVVNAFDPGAVGDVERMFADEIGRSTEVTLTDHEARPLYLRGLERLAYAVRYWL